MSDAFATFGERVLRIAPKYIDIFGRNVPGMSGRSAATAGAGNSASTVTLRLQHAVAELGRLYHDPDTAYEELAQLAKEIEGMFLVEQTLDTLTAEQAGQLIDELYNLIETKR